MFYLTTHSTHGVGHMVNDHTDNEGGNPLSPHGLLFPISSNGSFRQNSTYHGLCYTGRGALAVTRNSSMGPPRRTEPTIHCTMSERFYYISLLTKRNQSDYSTVLV